MKKVAYQKGQKITKRYIEKKQLVWFHYFRDGQQIPTELIPRNPHEIEAIEEIFFVYLHNLKDPSIMDKISQFSNDYLADHFQQELHRKRWSSRVNAMQRIVDFNIDRLANECLQMDPEKISSEEQFLRLKIIANLKEEAFISQLVSNEHVLSEHEYKRLFMDLSDGQFDQLLMESEELPMLCRYAVIDVVGMKRNPAHIPFLHKFLDSSESEIRIRSLKAIYEIGVVEDIRHYASFSKSSVWEERLMFTKLLIYLPSTVAMPYLRNLIKDTAWAVRMQAGRAIRKYPDGQERLQEIIHTETDAFAVDMAKSFLKVGEGQ